MSQAFCKSPGGSGAISISLWYNADIREGRAMTIDEAAANRQRQKKADTSRAQQAARWNPELCPCKKKSCPRYRDCDACREHHRTHSGLPYCERTRRPRKKSSSQEEGLPRQR